MKEALQRYLRFEEELHQLHLNGLGEDSYANELTEGLLDLWDDLSREDRDEVRKVREERAAKEQAGKNKIPSFPDMGDLFNSSVVANSSSSQSTVAVADDTKKEEINEEDIEVFAGDLISAIMKSWQYHVSEMPNNTATKKK